MEELKVMFPTAHPEIREVELETHQKKPKGKDRSRSFRDLRQVIRFDFYEQVMDLLGTTEIFANPENLNINIDPKDKNARWRPYVPPEGEENLDDVLDGKWYQETVEFQVTTRFGKVFWVPIIIYVDKTGTDAFQRHGLEPVIFTTPLIKCELRNHPKAWRILGFIPDLEGKSSAVKQKANQSEATKGISVRNYHKCLSVVLETFKDAHALG